MVCHSTVQMAAGYVHDLSHLVSELNTTSQKSWYRVRFTAGRKLLADGTPAPRVPKPVSVGLPPRNAEELARSWSPPDIRIKPNRKYVEPIPPAPGIPALQHTSMPTSMATHHNHYRQVHNYNTKEEALAWKLHRLRETARVYAKAPPSLASIRCVPPPP